MRARATACLCVFLSVSGLACGRLGFDPRQDAGAPDTSIPADTGTPDTSTPGDAGTTRPPLAQYFVDEASVGQGPTVLRDRMPDPVDLTINYEGGSPHWAEGSGLGRHLRFWGGSGVDTGGAMADAAGTKLDRLHGSTTATLEVKYLLDDCVQAVGVDGRLFGLGTGNHRGGHSWLTLRLWEGRETFAVNFDGDAFWTTYSLQMGTAPCPSLTPGVTHVVVDTDQADPNERVRAYRNGTRVSLAEAQPPQGATLNLGTGVRNIHLGRAHPDSAEIRDVRARIAYAAIYDVALTGLEVMERATLLRTDDSAGTPPLVDPLAPFGPAEAVTELNSAADEDDPTLRGDMLEIYFERSSDIWRSTRDSTATVFGAPEVVPELSSAIGETNPELSADGLTMHLGLGVTNEQFISTRPDLDSPWVTPTSIPELAGYSLASVAPNRRLVVVAQDLSPAPGSWDLFSATRPDHLSPWGAVTPLSINSAGEDQAPWLNGTSTLMVFDSTRDGTRQIWVSQRATASAPFGPPIKLGGLDPTIDESDAWLSPDLHTLYFVRAIPGQAREIYRATR